MSKCVYPEAQIEYTDAAGRKQRLNIRRGQREPDREGTRGGARRPGSATSIDRSNEGSGRGRKTRAASGSRSRSASEQALADVATYRVVSVKDLVDERFGGNAFAARKGIDALKRKGLLKEDSVQLPSRKSFKVLTATEKGLRQAASTAPAALSATGRVQDITAICGTMRRSTAPPVTRSPSWSETARRSSGSASTTS